MKKNNSKLIFTSPEHTVLRVSYCDHSPSVVRSHFLIYTLASTNINQSASNLVHMYMSIRSRMCLIMEIIAPELSELSALELKKIAIFDFVYTLASANIDQ